MTIFVVKDLEEYDYASVLNIRLEGGKTRISLELPVQVLVDVGWRPREGEEVEIEVSDKVKDGDWQIILSGKPLRHEKGKVVYSFGGLLCKIESPKIKIVDPVYLHLKVKNRNG